MDGAPLWAIIAGAVLQAALVTVYLVARRRLGAGSFYRLSAVVNFFVTGAMAGAGSWWAVMPASVAVGFATLGYTVPVREDRARHLASLIRAEREV